MVRPRCCCIGVPGESPYSSQAYLFSNFKSAYGLERIDMPPLRAAGGCWLQAAVSRTPQTTAWLPYCVDHLDIRHVPLQRDILSQYHRAYPFIRLGGRHLHPSLRLR
jgi:hypothetical protein